MASRKGAYNDTRILFKKKGFLIKYILVHLILHK